MPCSYQLPPRHPRPGLDGAQGMLHVCAGFQEDWPVLTDFGLTSFLSRPCVFSEIIGPCLFFTVTLICSSSDSYRDQISSHRASWGLMPQGHGRTVREDSAVRHVTSIFIDKEAELSRHTTQMFGHCKGIFAPWWEWSSDLGLSDSEAPSLALDCGLLYPELRKG